MFVDNRGALARSRDYNVSRQEPRYFASIPVGLQRFLRFGPFVTRGVSLDISVRGMSALVCGAPRAGETVVISLSLRDAAISLDLSSTLCLRLPNREFRLGYRN